MEIKTLIRNGLYLRQKKFFCYFFVSSSISFLTPGNAMWHCYPKVCLALSIKKG